MNNLNLAHAKEIIKRRKRIYRYICLGCKNRFYACSPRLPRAAPCGDCQGKVVRLSKKMDRIYTELNGGYYND